MHSETASVVRRVKDDFTLSMGGGLHVLIRIRKPAARFSRTPTASFSRATTRLGAT